MPRYVPLNARNIAIFSRGDARTNHPAIRSASRLPSLPLTIDGSFGRLLFFFPSRSRMYLRDRIRKQVARARSFTPPAPRRPPLTSLRPLAARAHPPFRAYSHDPQTEIQIEFGLFAGIFYLDRCGGKSAREGET